jgi:hypothetical protein
LYIQAGRSIDRCKAIALSSSGFHFRSIVFAAQAILEHTDPTVSHVLLEVYKRRKEEVSEETLDSLKDYVLEMCKEGYSSCEGQRLSDQVQVYRDRDDAIPPCLICGAFGVISDNDQVDTASPLYGVFNCEYAFVDAAKHLESFGTNFDFFRQSHKLPVLPSTAELVVTGSYRKSRSWFEKLQFPDGMIKSDEPLFCLKNGVAILTAHRKSPSIECYYTPQVENHPFIDRAFIAKHEDGGVCFVHVQAKVNGNVPDRIQGLNTAADMIKAEHSQMEVLCIVHVIGASGKTTTQTDLRDSCVMVRDAEQNDLRHSYVMVRDSDLTSFYSKKICPLRAICTPTPLAWLGSTQLTAQLASVRCTTMGGVTVRTR